MGWIIAVIIGVMLLLLILNMPSRRNIKKSASSSTTVVVTPKESSKGLGDTRVEETGEKLPEHTGLPAKADSQDKHEKIARKYVSKEAMPYANVGKDTKHHAHHDKQGKFEKSILSPFPEDFSPALSFLHEAYRLEEEGAGPEKIDSVLEKARQADPDVTALYLGRMYIIRRLRNEKQRNR